MKTLAIRTRKVDKTAKAYGQFFVKYTDIFRSLTICAGYFAIVFEVRNVEIRSNFVAQFIYSLLVSIDRAIGAYESYDYETAPYCGHSHCGHDGYFTKSHFHENENLHTPHQNTAGNKRARSNSL